MAEILGGSYNQVVGSYQQPHNYEAHHIYSYKAYKNVLDVSRGKGPAIRMEKADHQKTKSWGRFAKAQKYRAKQRHFLEQGKYKEAWEMDVKDIRSNFANKYDQHLIQAEKQLLTLDKENKIKLESQFKKELQKRQQTKQYQKSSAKEKLENIRYSAQDQEKNSSARQKLDKIRSSFNKEQQKSNNKQLHKKDKTEQKKQERNR